LIIGLFVAVAFASWIPFVVLGYDSLDALFEVVSATGTVGLSTGITSGELPALLKLVLCCDMLLGRVEIFAVLVALSPGSWFGNRSEAT
jgi:trk system potassium uptake protein TrkH